MWYFSRLTDFLAPKGEEKTLALVNASVSPLKYHIQTKSVFQKYTRGEFFRLLKLIRVQKLLLI